MSFITTPLLLALLVAPGSGAQSLGSFADDRSGLRSTSFCASGLESSTDGLELSARARNTPDPGINPGELVYADVEPATIPLHRKIPIRIKNLTVLGDVPQIELSLVPGGPERRFERTGTRMIDGSLVSVFDITIPRGDLFAGFRPPPIRFDHIDRGFPDTTGSLRLRSSAIPKTRVVRINDRVQYSSHVVNIVVPYDGLSVFGLPGEEIAAEFYRYFTDSYEELAFVPERVYSSPFFGARHQFVYQDIDGIGLAQMNDRPLYADSTVLRDWIFYIRGDLQSNFLSIHETGHNWGWFISLFEAAGREIEGSTECAGLEFDGSSVHAPLMADRHTFLSNCLLSPVYVARQGGGLRLAEARLPLAYHPLTLYAMGLADAEDVPRMHVSTDQGMPRSRVPGVRLEGGSFAVTMDDIQRRYGPRIGPVVPPIWRRATIVVSPDRLLSPKDLRWFNYWAKRVSDPDATGVESLYGVPSIEVATRGLVDVRTEIRPRSHPQVHGDFAVSYPEVGRRDIIGLKLKRKLGSRYEVGRTYFIEGRVKKATEYSVITARIGSKTFSGEIEPDRTFSIEIELEPEDRGRHLLTIGLGDLELVLARIAPAYVE